MAYAITLANYLNGKVSPKKVVDFVEAKLLEQGRAAIGAAGMCVYRSPDGAKCAAGWLIPDDKYVKDMDNPVDAGIALIITRYGLSMDIDPSTVDDNRLDLIRRLQGLHDNAARQSDINDQKFVDSIKERFVTLRKMFKLTA